MKAFILFISLIAIISSRPAIRREVAEYLKKIAKWNVVDPVENKFRDWTIEEVKAIMNTKRSIKHPEKINPQKINMKRKPNMDEYDFRFFYPECVLPVRDVQNCGGSWAFATVIPLQNRFCTGVEDFTFPLSVQDPISCSSENDGCNSGYLDKSIDYLMDQGTVDDDCFPFSAGEGDVEPCITECKNGAEWKKYKAAEAEAFWNQDDIIEDLEYNGPLSTSMDVYEDFLHYFPGQPYNHMYGDFLGSIGVMIIGYGYDFEDNYYWICQNNWGEDWGEFGYFKIFFGECMIDKMAYGQFPDFPDSKKIKKIH